MKQINCILLFLLLSSCSSILKPTESNSKPTKFVFRKSLVTSQSGMVDLESKTDSLIKKKIKEVQLAEFLPQTPEVEIYVEIHNDSIWRHTKENGKIIGDYFMLQKNSGIINFYDKLKSVNYKKYDLFAENYEYEIIENRTDSKEIAGFECYKLTLIKLAKESNFGNTIYEMYVTDQLDLPLHSVINLTKLVPNTFPMEIKVLEEKISGMSEIYKLIGIE